MSLLFDYDNKYCNTWLISHSLYLLLTVSYFPFMGHKETILAVERKLVALLLWTDSAYSTRANSCLYYKVVICIN